MAFRSVVSVLVSFVRSSLRTQCRPRGAAACDGVLAPAGQPHIVSQFEADAD